MRIGNGPANWVRKLDATVADEGIDQLVGERLDRGLESRDALAGERAVDELALPQVTRRVSVDQNGLIGHPGPLRRQCPQITR
jgi:hypothetical protein